MNIASSRSVLAACSLAASLFLGACTATQERPSQPSNGDGSVTTKPVIIDGGLDGTPVDPDSVAGRAPRDRVIYFDFDSAQISPRYLSVITAHGRFLAQNPTGKVRLEGHTDERGTREYNVALGEGRAVSISRMMQLQGVSPGQVSVISFGEELPVADGQSESAWSQNRRVNIIYSLDE